MRKHGGASRGCASGGDDPDVPDPSPDPEEGEGAPARKLIRICSDDEASGSAMENNTTTATTTNDLANQSVCLAGQSPENSTSPMTVDLPLPLSLGTLPTHPLTEIFRRMPLRERFKMENVCRRFRALMVYDDISTVCNEDALSRSLPAWSTRRLKGFLEFMTSRAGPHLSGLELRQTEMCRSLFDFIREHFTALSSFTIRQCSIASALDLPALPDVARLCMQNISFPMLDDPISISKCLSAALSSKSKIEHLNLYGAIDTTGIALAHPHVKGICFEGLKEFRDSDLRFLCYNCPNVESLNISNTGVSDLKPIGGLRKLRALFLAKLKVSNEGSLQDICDGCVNLRVVDIGHCTGISDLSPLRTLRDLRSLQVWQCKFMTDAKLRHICKRGTLTSVNLGFTSVSEKGILTVAKFCPLMQKMVIHLRESTPEEYPYFVRHLLHNAPSLTHFCCHPSGNEKYLFDAVLDKGARLRILGLINCTNWTALLAFGMQRSALIRSGSALGPLLLKLSGSSAADLPPEVTCLKDELAKTALLHITSEKSMRL